MMNVNSLSEYFENAYREIGALNADILYIYSDFRYFGALTQNLNRNEFCDAVIHPLLKYDKTIIIATFTYTADGVFSVYETRTKLGALNRWINENDKRVRSEHPIFSFAALGSKANLVLNIGKSAFGYDSIYHRIRGQSAAFLHIGRPVSMGNTALHYIEHICGATYRFHKAFRTKIYRGKDYIGTDYTAFVRRQDVIGEDFAFDFKVASRELEDRGLIKKVGDDRNLSSISFYWYDDVIDALADMFYKNQRLFIRSDYINY
jgi:aminoglycoside N3'-acetyltransferase